jgi:hypothetical protein
MCFYEEAAAGSKIKNRSLFQNQSLLAKLL